jgi:hypothetical protein
MIQLFNNETNAFIGEISDDQLQFLINELVEEEPGDTDYYLNEATLDLLAEDGAPAELIALLRQALDEDGEVEIRWKRA